MRSRRYRRNKSTGYESRLADQQLKKEKLKSEYFEKFVTKSLTDLRRQREKELALLESLEREISRLDLIESKISKMYQAKRDLSAELRKIEQTIFICEMKLKNLSAYEQATFIGRFFQNKPHDNKEDVIAMLEANKVRADNVKVAIEELVEQANKQASLHGGSASSKQNSKLRSATQTKISNAKLRLEVLEKAILYLEEKDKHLTQLKTETDSKIESYKAYKAALMDRTRELGKEVRKGLLEQIEILDGCPYCGGNLDNTMHADHIYPVSKGGLSSVRNMILVCRLCNLAKSNYTLREFIERNGLDRDVVEENLRLLRKDF